MTISFSDMLLATRMDTIRFALIDIGKQARVAFTADRLACFHLLLSGELDIQPADGERLRLQAGDFVLALRGVAHRLAMPDATHTTKLSLRSVSVAEEARLLRIAEGGGAKVLSGCFGLDQSRDGTETAPVESILRTNVGDPHSRGFLNFPDRASFEAACFGAGARAYIASLVRLLYVQTLREALSSRLATESVNLKLLGLPQISTARRLIDAEPGAPWRLETLARTVGMSRPVFAERFTPAVGGPPMQYVTRARLDRAAQLLAFGLPVSEVAARVGYAAPSAFSRAFRRQFSGSPRKYIGKTS